MKTGWVTKRLGEVCEEIRERIASGNITPRQYVGTENMLKECAGIVDSESVPKDVGLVHYQKGDILLSNIRPYLKKSWLSDRDGGCSSDVIVFRPSQYVVAEYLWRVLSQDRFFDYSMLKVGGAKMPRGDRNWIKAFEFSYPESLAEQKRIVAKIDAAFEKIDKLKANAERNLANAKELFQSALNEAMRPKPGWVEKRLGEVCRITSALVDPTEKIYSKLLHVGGANIIGNTDELVELKSAEEEKLRSGKFCFDSTMVLYNKIRPYLKKVARPDFAGLCSADMYPLAPTEGIDRDYLYYVLLSDEFTSYAMANSERAGMPKLNRAALFGYLACWPKSKGEQSQVAKTLDALACSCTRLQSNYTRLIADCAEMRQAVLKEAFEGRL